MPLEGWKTSRNPFVSKHKKHPFQSSLPPQRCLLNVKKRAQWVLLYFNLSPCANTSKGLCWALLPIPARVPLLCSQHWQIQTRAFPESCSCQSLHRTPWVFASFLTTFTAFQSLPLPVFIRLFCLLTTCHTALCLHTLTCLGSADLSSSHKQEIRCGKQRFLCLKFSQSVPRSSAALLARSAFY